MDSPYAMLFMFVSTHASVRRRLTYILFLKLLNETRAMVRASFSLLKEQQKLFAER